MATRTFEIRTKPHEAIIGTDTLLFEPEVIGSVFASSYDKLRAVQKKMTTAGGVKASSTKHAKGDDIDADTLGEMSEAMREFVGSFLLPDSKPVFDRLRLPDRVLVDLMTWVAELYGGGSGNPAAAGGTSSG